MAREASTREDVTLSFWAVAFLDLLGYRSVLEAMDVFPLTDSGAKRALVEAAFTRAIRLRRRLLGLLDDFLKAHNRAPAPNLEQLPQEAASLLEGMRKVRVLKVAGPDHVVLACSLSPDEEHFPLRGVYSLLAAAASACLLQLRMGGDDPLNGLPLRGGIDVALGGIDPRDEYLYSPALARAYDLEQKSARYPRVVVGDRLQEYLTEKVREVAQGLAEQVSTQLAARTMQLIFKDSDGKWVLDFFGKAVRELVPTDLSQEMAAKAWEFARFGQEHFRRSDQSELSEKYQWLVDYMRPRLELWGVRA